MSVKNIALMTLVVWSTTGLADTGLDRCLESYESGRHEKAWLDCQQAKDYVHGLFMLGMMLDNGEGVDEDDAEAFFYYMSAAVQGSRVAMFRLGQLYEFGDEPIEPDQQEAARWYRMAAEAGHLQSALNLGLMYRDGDLTSRDMTTAFEWVQKAAHGGLPTAQYEVARMAGWPRVVTHPRLPQIRACPTRAPGSSNDGLAAQRYTLCTTRAGGRG